MWSLQAAGVKAGAVIDAHVVSANDGNWQAIQDVIHVTADNGAVRARAAICYAQYLPWSATTILAG